LGTLLIGLGHRARQGKNFVANYILEQAGARASLYAFADELKLYCKEHHEELEPQWQLANQTKQKPGWKDDPIYGCTPILQWYGTDVARKQDPDTWVKALHARLSRENPEIAIVTDCRFINEAEYIKKAGGFLIEVIRRNADGTQFVDPGRDPNHISETALEGFEGWDCTIDCRDGDLKNLRAFSIGIYNFVTGDYALDTLIDQTYSEAVLKSIEDSDATGFAG